MTSLEELLKAEKCGFSIVILQIGEIASSNDETYFPVISTRMQLCVKTLLDANKEDWMSNVWERIAYSRLLLD